MRNKQRDDGVALKRQLKKWREEDSGKFSHAIHGDRIYIDSDELPDGGLMLGDSELSGIWTVDSVSEGDPIHLGDGPWPEIEAWSHSREKESGATICLFVVVGLFCLGIVLSVAYSLLWN